MPASRSPSRIAERQQPVRRRWPWILVGALALLGAGIAVAPASSIKLFLPAQVHADDFSGSLLHGAAGQISVSARDAGALEWRLHPWPLLRLALVADIHWVKIAFVLDGTVEIHADGIEATGLKGGGPIDSLSDLGVAAGWRGNAQLAIADIRADRTGIKSARGSLMVTDLSSPTVAQGVNLGGYELRMPDIAAHAAEAGVPLTAALRDTGGPLEVLAEISFAPDTRTGLLTGTVRERPEASAELVAQLEHLAQLKPRDSSGRIPVDLEFTL